MKKRKKAALYDPYLDVLGGGEKHILSILKVLENEEYEIHIFWDKNLQDDFKVQFDLSFKYVPTFLPNIFQKKTAFLKKILTLKNYDCFFYVTDGSYFFSNAKKNFVFCMVPNKSLYNMNFVNKLKTANFRFIANSKFTQSRVLAWGIKSKVIYPYLDDRFIKQDIRVLPKEKIILSVGRFFRQLHAKQHKSLISFFKKLKASSALYKDFKLVLVGGLRGEDKDYFEELKEAAKQESSIILKPNVLFDELFTWYGKAGFLWHFTGFGIDETKYPQRVEHLGIVPLEAMAMGCIAFCYNAGGPRELIDDGKNGFLFTSEKELVEKMTRLAQDQMLQKRIQNEAKEYVRKHFNYEVFRKRVREAILEN